MSGRSDVFTSDESNANRSSPSPRGGALAFGAGVSPALARLGNPSVATSTSRVFRMTRLLVGGVSWSSIARAIRLASCFDPRAEVLHVHYILDRRHPARRVLARRGWLLLLSSLTGATRAPATGMTSNPTPITAEELVDICLL